VGEREEEAQHRLARKEEKRRVKEEAERAREAELLLAQQ
jgi:hypothetical protein